jgi:hypothetical protein
VYPARHFASDLTHPDLPAMGSGCGCGRGYGMILADNGAPWYLSGAPHRRWDNDQLHMLHRVPGSAFEVVDTARLPRP